MLALRLRDDFSRPIEDDEARRRRALIDRADVSWHAPSRFSALLADRGFIARACW
jgi:hypothetical protein